MKSLTIIIPVHNTANYLRQTIESVLTQTFTNFELLIIDDGSNDGSEDIADEYATKDTRIKVIHESNRGVATARNIAIDIAIGEYLIFIDSDDYYSNPKAFELIVAECKKSRPDILFYGYTDLDLCTGKTRKSQIGFDHDSFNLSKSEWLNYIYDSGLFPTACWQLVVKRNYVNSHSIRFPITKACEDIDWCIKLLFYAERYSYVDESLMTYRRNRKGSIMFNRGWQHLYGCILAVKNWHNIPSEKRYLGLTNFVAHMYGFTFVYYTTIPTDKRKNAEVEFKQQAYILMESDKWNHHLIYHTLKLFGVPFTSWMINIVYRIFYAPTSILGGIRRKFQ